MASQHSNTPPAARDDDSVRTEVRELKRRLAAGERSVASLLDTICPDDDVGTPLERLNYLRTFSIRGNAIRELCDGSPQKLVDVIDKRIAEGKSYLAEKVQELCGTTSANRPRVSAIVDLLIRYVDDMTERDVPLRSFMMKLAILGVTGDELVEAFRCSGGDIRDANESGTKTLVAEINRRYDAVADAAVSSSLHESCPYDDPKAVEALYVGKFGNDAPRDGPGLMDIMMKPRSALPNEKLGHLRRNVRNIMLCVGTYLVEKNSAHQLDASVIMVKISLCGMCGDKLADLYASEGNSIPRLIWAVDRMFYRTRTEEYLLEFSRTLAKLFISGTASDDGEDVVMAANVSIVRNGVDTKLSPFMSWLRDAQDRQAQRKSDATISLRRMVEPALVAISTCSDKVLYHICRQAAVMISHDITDAAVDDEHRRLAGIRNDILRKDFGDLTSELVESAPAEDGGESDRYRGMSYGDFVGRYYERPETHHRSLERLMTMAILYVVTAEEDALSTILTFMLHVEVKIK